jgi:hypothetical protein
MQTQVHRETLPLRMSRDLALRQEAVSRQLRSPTEQQPLHLISNQDRIITVLTMWSVVESAQHLPHSLLRAYQS